MTERVLITLICDDCGEPLQVEGSRELGTLDYVDCDCPACGGDMTAEAAENLAEADARDRADVDYDARRDEL